MKKNNHKHEGTIGESFQYLVDKHPGKTLDEITRTSGTDLPAQIAKALADVIAADRESQQALATAMQSAAEKIDDGQEAEHGRRPGRAFGLSPRQPGGGRGRSSRGSGRRPRPRGTGRPRERCGPTGGGAGAAARSRGTRRRASPGRARWVVCAARPRRAVPCASRAQPRPGRTPQQRRSEASHQGLQEFVAYLKSFRAMREPALV